MDTRRAHPILMLLVLLAGDAWAGGVFDELERLSKPARLAGARDFLPADQAFRLSEQTAADGALELHWDIEPGYYLYRDKLAFTPNTAGLELAPPTLPAGETKDDPEFGPVKVLTGAATARLPVVRAPAGADLLQLEVKYQGCAEDGICYPPIRKQVAFTPQPTTAVLTDAAASAAPAADRFTARLQHGSPFATLAVFLGFGLLLSFTPCVLPMVPILSGIIVGQRAPVGARRGLSLSATYVVAMAATYALAGVAAGLLGHNLQAAFQHPAVLAGFSALFVALALSMFGLYELQIPATLQARLDQLSRGQRGGSHVGAGVMGMLSALIVGPCVAPPLAGALAYISRSGSAALGGGALFALGLGMGLPLIALGASAGGLLPRAGAWMVTVKQVFGVVFLAVAIDLLSRIVPGPVTLLLWAALLCGSAVCMGAVEHGAGRSGWRKVGQGIGLAGLVYGAALVVGAAAGGDDPLQPLAPLLTAHGPAPAAAQFVRVKSLAELEAEIERAHDAGQAIMLDFYADWCIECKHLERRTFAHADVAQRLARLRLLRADVTANDDDDQALLRHYGLFGPPAVLFFAAGHELRDNRVNGFVDAAEFASHLDRLPAQ